MTIAQAVRAAVKAGQDNATIIAMIQRDHPTCANPARTVAYYRSEARTAFSLEAAPRQGIATMVRAKLAAGVAERDILAAIIADFPSCVNPRRTLRFYQREVRRAAQAA